MDNYENKLSREVEKQIERDKKAARTEGEKDRELSYSTVGSRSK